MQRGIEGSLAINPCICIYVTKSAQMQKNVATQIKITIIRLISNLSVIKRRHGFVSPHQETLFRSLLMGKHRQTDRQLDCVARHADMEDGVLLLLA